MKNTMKKDKKQEVLKKKWNSKFREIHNYIGGTNVMEIY